MDRYYAITNYPRLKNIILNIDPFKCRVKNTKWDWCVWYLGERNGDRMMNNELGHDSNGLIKIQGVKGE